MAQPKLTGSKGKIALALGAAATIALAIPTAGWALGGKAEALTGPNSPDFAFFTPASVDPQLAKRVQDSMRAKGLDLGFTPAGSASTGNRTVTVAVRVNNDAANAISIRPAGAIARSAPGARAVAIAPTRYNLGVARGYQSFTTAPDLSATARTSAVRDVAMPDLAEYQPAKGIAKSKPSRFQPRIVLDAEEKTGRSPRTRDALGDQSVDLGGAYRVTKNLDVTAGVRLSQERDRLDPLTDSVQDSQAVYVGTQFRF